MRNCIEDFTGERIEHYSKMSQYATHSEEIDTTTLLAHQEGPFELVEVKDWAPLTSPIVHSTQLDDIEATENLFEAEQIALQIETVDGNVRTCVLNPHYLAYDGRAQTLEQVLCQDEVWLADTALLGIDHSELPPDFDILLAPDIETARRVKQDTDAIDPRSGIIVSVVSAIALIGIGLIGVALTPVLGIALLATLTYAAYLIIKTTGTRDRDSNIITGYEKSYTKPLPESRSNLNVFSSVAPTASEKAEINRVKSPNRIEFIKDGETFDMTFNGRLASDSHPPSELADGLGVRAVENLENEQVLLAPNVHPSRGVHSCGSNAANTFVLGFSE